MFAVILRLILLSVGLALASVAGAANIPLLTDNLTKADAPPEVPLPEPAALDAGWWRYFEVKGDKLDEHVKTMLTRLDNLTQELPAELLETTAPLIKLIKANLQALPQVRAQPNPDLPPPVVYAERYTVEQLLDIARQQRDVNVALVEERQDVSSADKAVKALKRRIDTLTAAYLGLAATDPARVLRGLEIMAERSEVGVAEERLRLRTATLQADELRVRQLEEELAVAAERLEAQYADLARLNAAIEQARQELEQARDRVLKAQTSALDVVADAPEEQATARYRQQRVLRAAVAEAQAQARLIRLLAERQLVSLLLGTVGVDTSALREQMALWQTQLAEMRTRTTAWLVESERERGRTGAAMALDSAAAADATADFLKLINQDRFALAQETLIALQRLDEEIMQAELVMVQVEKQLLLKEGRLSDWLARGEQVLEDTWNRLTEWISTSLFRIGETPVTALGLLRIALILTIAWWISYWLRRALNQLAEMREGSNVSAYYTVGRLSHYVIMIIGLMVGLSSIGMDFTNFALVAGALAIGIGFGLQAIVNNFISGLILLFERSLKVGDFVELASGVEGEVREINVRSTVINTNDNVDIVVPNSEFMNSNVINWTLVEDYRRIHLPFKVAYGTDKELVRQAGLEAAEKVPHTLSGIPGKNPAVWLVGFGDSWLNFEVVVWITPRAVKRPGAVQAAYMWEIETALRKYGIDIPYPQRDLHLKSGFRELLTAPVAPTTVTERPAPAAVALDKPADAVAAKH